jgi:transcriptional regulator of aromatic amino acid metabolism
LKCCAGEGGCDPAAGAALYAAGLRADSAPALPVHQTPSALLAPLPGNVRLQNVIRAAAICESNLVQIDDMDIASTVVALQQADGEVAA